MEIGPVVNRSFASGGPGCDSHILWEISTPLVHGGKWHFVGITLQFADHDIC